MTDLGITPAGNEKLIAEVARMIADFAAHDGPVDAFFTAKVMVGMFEKAYTSAETEAGWEYGATNVWDDQPVTIVNTLTEGQRAQQFYTRERGRQTNLMMRTKAIPAGPWVPVVQESA